MESITPPFCLSGRIRTCEHVLPRHAHITNCGTPSIPCQQDRNRTDTQVAQCHPAFSICLLVVLVGVAGLEPTTSCSQSTHATNCATPRTNYLLFSTVAILPWIPAAFAGLSLNCTNCMFSFFNIFVLLLSFAIIKSFYTNLI